jgi:hypothetical protein
MRNIALAADGLDFYFISGPQHEGTRPQCKTVPEAIKILEDLLAIQCSDGNWNYDDYMMGMANGLICALSCINGEEPKYMTKPSTGWLADRPKVKAEPSVALSSSMTDYDEIELKQKISGLLYVLKAADNIVDTPGKAYNVFKKFGITGFKTPKISSGKGKQIVKSCSIKTKSGQVFWISIKSHEGQLKYELRKPGEENYTSITVVKSTKDLNKFIEALTKVRGLSEYHTAMKEYLAAAS